MFIYDFLILFNLGNYCCTKPVIYQQYINYNYPKLSIKNVNIIINDTVGIYVDLKIAIQQLEKIEERISLARLISVLSV